MSSGSLTYANPQPPAFLLRVTKQVSARFVDFSFCMIACLFVIDSVCGTLTAQELNQDSRLSEIVSSNHRFASSLLGKLVTEDVFEEGEKSITAAYDFKHGAIVREYHWTERSQSPALAIGINDDYCFELNKRRPQGAWQIRLYVVTNEPDIDTIKVGLTLPEKRLAKLDARYFYACRGLDNQWVSAELLQTSAEFKVVALQSLENGDVVVSYRRQTKPLGPTQQSYEIEGKVMFSKSQHWFLSKLEEQASGGPNQSLVCDLIHEFDGDKLLSANVTEEYLTNGKVVKVGYQSQITYAPLERSRFTLSHYGFPEPTELSQPWIGSWILYAAAITIAVLLIAAAKRLQAK